MSSQSRRILKKIFEKMVKGLVEWTKWCPTYLARMRPNTTKTELKSPP
jgi:hypothetical protein